jgi:hypothetical protein
MKHADGSEPLGSRRTTTETSASTGDQCAAAGSTGSRHHWLQRWRYASAVQAARAINVLGSRSPAGPDGASARMAD